MRARSVGLLGALVWTLALAAPVAAVDLTWVGIGGPTDWQPNPGYSLEIGPTAWTVDALNGGGLTTVDLNAPTIVRVRRLPDCVPVVRFVAEPGGRYFIRFAANGTARVEDLTGQGMDTPGPPGDPGPLVCPRLPDTSTATTPPAPERALPGWAALLLGAGLLALGARSRRGARRSPVM
jgi:hypothetical protein